MNDLNCTSLHSLAITQYNFGIDPIGNLNKCYSSCHSFPQHHSSSATLDCPYHDHSLILLRESPPITCSHGSPFIISLYIFPYQEIALKKLLGQHHVWSVRRHCIGICHSSKHCDSGNKRQSSKLADDSHRLAWLYI